MDALRRGAYSDGTTTEHSQTSNGYLQAPLGRAARRGRRHLARRLRLVWCPRARQQGLRPALELNIPWPESNPVNAGLRKAADEFGATQGRCTVQLTVVSPWNEETLTAGVAGGRRPLTLLAPTSVTTWGPQDLEPLDDVFQRDKLSGNDFFPPVWRR